VIRFIARRVKAETIIEGDSVMKVKVIPVTLEGNKIVFECSGGCLFSAAK